jgi:hypothetical protein
VGEIQCSTIYTGKSSEKKANNWEVLGSLISKNRTMYLILLLNNVVFKRNDIDISKETMHAVMHCYPDAAIKLIENVYMILTKRSLPPRLPVIIYILYLD